MNAADRDPTSAEDLPAVLAAFEMDFLEDRATGSVKPAESYAATYPGFESAILRHHARLSARTPDLRTDEAITSLTGLGKPAPVGLSVMPEKLLHYEFRKELGRGGQGSVWLAEDTRLHRKVAIKLLDHVGAASPDGLQRFLREALVAGRLEHPGICAVFDAGVGQGRPFIAMRYVAGETLARKLAAARERGLPPRVLADDGAANLAAVLAFLEQAARALHTAHEAGVVHRDVKPGNLMVTPEGAPVVLDFGLAQDLESGEGPLTRSGDRLGTPAYMAPEQLRGTAIDRRCDLWSLGVVLYECLTLERPFTAPTFEGLARAVLADPLTDPRRRNRALSRDVATVIETALERDPERRYRTALDFAEDLRRLRAKEPILARRAGAVVRFRRWMQRNPVVATLTFALFAALLAGMLWTDHKNRELAKALRESQWLADAKMIDPLLEVSLKLPSRDERDLPLLLSTKARADEIVARWNVHRELLAEGAEVHSEAPDRAWRTLVLRELGTKIQKFTDQEHGGLAKLEAAIEYASSVRTKTLLEPVAAWQAACEEIADPARCPLYAGLHLEPQLGLLPLGRNPRSGLHEFAYPRSGRVPTRDAKGELEVADDTAIVFVLVPGGHFAMGAWRPSEEHPVGAPNVDPGAGSESSPVVDVALAAFFLSKYELTQAQYLRLVGSNPSLARAGYKHSGQRILGRNPVENITWTSARELATALGFELPTEAQWEYAARAGTTTVWWAGNEREAMKGGLNIADLALVRSGSKVPTAEGWKEFDDGFAMHAPVGSFRANPWGFFDTAGNVAEWCRDEFDGLDYGKVRDPEDGLVRRPGDGRLRRRAIRGGAFITDALEAASAARSYMNYDDHASGVGVRLARRVERR